MAGRLNGFLDRAWRTPFEWGRFDCILFLADWSVEIGAGDPAQPFRSGYRSPLGAARIIRKAGGLAALVAREFEPLGWMRTDGPEAGDIGIVRTVTANGESEVGGLCLGDRCAVIGPAGLLISDTRFEAAWRRPCPKPSRP